MCVQRLTLIKEIGITCIPYMHMYTYMYLDGLQEVADLVGLEKSSGQEPTAQSSQPRVHIPRGGTGAGGVLNRFPLSTPLISGANRLHFRVATVFPRYLRLLRGAGEVVWRRSFSRLLRAPVMSEAEGRVTECASQRPSAELWSKVTECASQRPSAELWSKVTECASQRPSAELWSKVTDRERGILSSGQREGLPL